MIHPNAFGETSSSQTRLVEESQIRIAAHLKRIRPTHLGVEGAIDGWNNHDIMGALENEPTMYRTADFCKQNSVTCFGIGHSSLNEIFDVTLRLSKAHAKKNCVIHHAKLLIEIVHADSVYALASSVKVLAATSLSIGAVLIGTNHLPDFQELGADYGIKIHTYDTDPEKAVRIL